jgi:diketogulonate reductase-like aldo/keto reductase
MESCFKSGLARNIGVSNCAIQHLEAILSVATIKPAVNQIEMHPYLSQPELHQYLKQKGIAVEGYAPLTPLSRVAPGPLNEICSRLAEKYGVSDSAILLQCNISQGAVVITTSARKARLQEYLNDVPKFSLTAEEIEELNHASAGKHHRAFFTKRFEAIEEA